MHVWNFFYLSNLSNVVSFVIKRASSNFIYKFHQWQSTSSRHSWKYLWTLSFDIGSLLYLNPLLKQPLTIAGKCRTFSLYFMARSELGRQYFSNDYSWKPSNLIIFGITYFSICNFRLLHYIIYVLDDIMTLLI